MADQAQIASPLSWMCIFFSSPTNHSAPMAVINLALRRKSCQQQLSLKQLAHNVHIDKRASVRTERTQAKPEESLMAGELNSVQESIKLALDAADAATDVTSEYSQVKREHKKLEKSVTDSPLHHHYFCHRNCRGCCGADVFRHTVF